MAPLLGKPFGAFLQDVAHPVQGFKIVRQRRSAKQAHFGNVGRPLARLATPAFQAFQQRRFFATDVSPGTTSQLELGQGARRHFFEVGQGLRQALATAMVFVAQIDEHFLGAHHLRRNQHTLQEPMRVALQVDPVLEGARLALIEVHSQVARAGLAAHNTPFPTHRETCPAQSAQPRGVQRVQNMVVADFPIDHSRCEFVPALRTIVRQRNGAIHFAVIAKVFLFNRLLNLLRRREIDGILVHHGHRRLSAAAHTRRGYDTYIGAEQLGQARQQIARAGHGAAEAVTHTHRQGCGLLAIFQQVEVVVKTGDLEHFGARQVHLVRQGHQMMAVQAPVGVLQAVQVLDQQVAAMALRRRLTNERAHLGQRGVFRLTAAQLQAHLNRFQDASGLRA